MTGESGKQENKQAFWVEMPRSGQVVKTLNRNGVVPEGQTYGIGPTTTPMPVPSTPPPTPSPTPKTLAESSRPVNSPGRYVNEVPGVSPTHIRRLTKGGIESLAALASAVATDVAHILSISEVKAMGFIDEAGRLLQSTSCSDQAGG